MVKPLRPLLYALGPLKFISALARADEDLLWVETTKRPWYIYINIYIYIYIYIYINR